MASTHVSAPPLAQFKVVEFAGIGPGPMVGMILADFGANVIRVDRPSLSTPDVFNRGKRCITLNAKVPSARDVLRRLIERADILIDPSRPGFMESVDLGPNVFLGDPITGKEGRNRRLIYARLAGFSRTGPHKNMAGHDLSYLALSGVLSLFPGEKKPTFPLNILGSFAGGSVVCALGILLALVERQQSGLGQVVNADMVSGTRYISTFPILHSLYPTSARVFTGPRGTNMLDGGAPFYDTYTCADGLWMSVACVEPHFFRAFLDCFCAALPGFTLDGWRPTYETPEDHSSWPRLREFMDRGFKMHSRDYWTRVFHGTDACALPVLSVTEAAASVSGSTSSSAESMSPVPAPHPELARTPSVPINGITSADSFNMRGQHTDEVLSELGLTKEEKIQLLHDGALGKRTARL
ncbi:CoA-transferase family III [Sparassis latifolia]